MANTTVGRTVTRVGARPRTKTGDTARRAGLYVLVVVLTVYCLFPFYWALVSSFKGDAEL